MAYKAKSLARLAGAGLLAGVLLFGGCSWSMFGSGKDAEPETQKAETADKADSARKSDLELGAGSEDKSKKSKGVVAPPKRSKGEKVEYTPLDEAKPEEKPEEAGKPDMAAKADVKKTEPDSAKKEVKKGADTRDTEITAVEPKKDGEPEVEIKVKGRVPIERAKPDDNVHTGDIEYRSSAELQEAVQRAIDKKQFLGYTDPFDAFPVLPGPDTISAAFIPVEYPNHKVFYHAFYQKDKPFHTRVYGYTVIDMRTNQDFGHFDGDADGIFEQKTLDPKIVLDDYLRTSGDKPLGKNLDKPQDEKTK